MLTSERYPVPPRLMMNTTAHIPPFYLLRSPKRRTTSRHVHRSVDDGTKQSRSSTREDCWAIKIYDVARRTTTASPADPSSDMGCPLIAARAVSAI